MKTIEQKAKAYDEAFDKIRKLYAGANSTLIVTTKSLLEKIFPELRESEDEKIRRTLVEYFGPEVQLDFVRGVPIQKIRDWLEKQKELDKKIIEKANAYDEALRIATDSFNDTDKHVKATLGRIFPSISCITAERQKEDTVPNSNELIALWDTEKKKLDENCCGDWWGLARNAFMDGFKLGLKEKQKEQKPRIEICPHSIKSKSYRENGVPTESISDELVDIIKGEFEGFRTLLKKKGIDYEPQRSYWEAFARLFDSSAREYVKEQKPAWSEEDEKMLADTFFKLAGFMGNEKNLDWLKSIKNLFSHERGC